jgi:c-di-GMP-binding flagellar brake protein YcgR
LSRLCTPASARGLVLLGEAALATALAAGRCVGQPYPPHAIRDFNFGSSHEGTRLAVLVVTVAAVVVLVGYAIHHILRGRQVQEAERSLAADLDRIHGYVDVPDLLRPGDRVEIEVSTPKTQRLYHTRVEAVDTTTADLIAPVEEGTIVPIRVGDHVGVVARRTPFSYRFQTRVVRRDGGRVPTLTIEMRTRVLRFQRREFVRFDVSFEATVEAGGAQGARRASPTMQATILNVSGAGLLIETTRRLPKSRFVSVAFALPDGKSGAVHAECRVVSATIAHAGQSGGTRFGVQFIEIKRQHRERIIAYVMTLERRRRRRELEDADRAEAAAARRAHGRPPTRPGGPS